MEIKWTYVVIAVQALIILYLLYKDKFVDWRRLRKIKRSGDYGERLVSDYLDNMEDVFHIYHGVQGSFDRQHFEIDHLLLVHQGVILIETKNIRGTIIAKKNSWCQIKKSESGRPYERDFRSPINQIERTSRIFEAFLNSKGIKTKVCPVVVFSVRDVELKLPPQKYPVILLHELETTLQNISRDVPLSTRQLRKLKEVIDEEYGK